jgi:hypothetical protein
MRNSGSYSAPLQPELMLTKTRLSEDCLRRMGLIRRAKPLGRLPHDISFAETIEFMLSIVHDAVASHRQCVAVSMITKCRFRCALRRSMENLRSVVGGARRPRRSW